MTNELAQGTTPPAVLARTVSSTENSLRKQGREVADSFPDSSLKEHRDPKLPKYLNTSRAREADADQFQTSVTAKGPAKRELEGDEGARDVAFKKPKLGGSVDEKSPSPAEEMLEKDEAVHAVEGSLAARKAVNRTEVSAEEHPRRGARIPGKKAACNRQLNNKNFLKSVLPNLTRLSRTEILQDLRVMEGGAARGRDRER
uniref:Uncharacterized protein n=1 Tax=Tetraselmis sp. GSL018 TaxID=582737 RepID=A0A061SM22_9CHLO|mmetsp:Transcript_12688/g.30091  ORF Transcript_12688/g.30091 Transcript_12688/m.30091 type:complete len:201 (+) Transcript_12688:514-1116(+)|eukprot:CAMPEP_0177580818 /NCGR_PEP_ID=MMETSP0419_2-20121207/1790_1 /TAXON_ID=582737 /ORGANISM="Tetraselmis sp., Strain GSL018" /LENGTH=200 /DNA_ID=CAMNT_0019069765 /DNA_START=449 /DNA_END=1051 /DNA_ORIENTATION=-